MQNRQISAINESHNLLSINSEWIGREYCKNCHFCKLFSAELSESGATNSFQPVDHFLFPSGSVIYSNTTHRKFIYTIRHGMVKLTNNARNGGSRIVRLLGPGDSIGLELLDGNNGYHHTAVAVDNVDVCRIPVSIIKRNIAKRPSIYTQISHQLQNQLDLADQWIVALGTGTARQRVAHLLLLLDGFFADENGAFTLINREDMAAVIGTTVETVSRMIAEFKRQNILCKYKSKNSLYTCNTSMLNAITLHA